jgi:predicted component of type VI protein secretion system
MPILEFDRQARPLGPGVLTIGSGPEAGWRVLEHDLAPIHALVTLERDGRAHLARPRDDVRILVNGVAMADPVRVIKAGDAITLGDATFHMRAARRQDDASEASYLRDMSRGRAWRIVDRLEVGRDPACPVHLSDPDVSRVHAEILRGPAGVVVRQKGGVVFLNGNRVTGDMPLSEGDELSIGRTMLRFTHETPASAAVVAPATDLTRRPSIGDSRLSRAQTSYMGVVQAREHLDRARRKEWMKVVRVVLVALGLVVGAAVIASGRASVGLKSGPRRANAAKAANTGGPSAPVPSRSGSP